MMTIPEALDLMQLMKEHGIDSTAEDEVGLMRAKKFYQSLGWREKRDFYIFDGKMYLNVDFRPRAIPNGSVSNAIP